MNLYFRLFLTLFKNLFIRTRYNITDKMVWKGRVLLNDIDVFGHMNNGRYLTLVGLALLDAGIKSGNLPDTLKYKYVYLFAQTDMQWLKPLRLFEKFSIESQMRYWEGNRAHIEANFFNQRGQLAARAKYRVVLKSPIRKNVTWGYLMPDNVGHILTAPTPTVDHHLDETG